MADASRRRAMQLPPPHAAVAPHRVDAPSGGRGGRLGTSGVALSGRATASVVALVVVTGIVVLHHGSQLLAGRGVAVPVGSERKSMQQEFARLHERDSIRGAPAHPPHGPGAHGHEEDGWLSDTGKDAGAAAARVPGDSVDAFPGGPVDVIGSSPVLGASIAPPDDDGDDEELPTADDGAQPPPSTAVAPGDDAMAAEVARERAARAPGGAPVRVSSHPVLFPARFAGGATGEGELATLSPECEPKWGNTWLREFAESRAEVCAPVAAAASDGLRAALAAVSVRSDDGTPGWRGDDWESGGDGDGAPRANWTRAGPSRAVSRITSWRATTGASFHWMRNVALDFSQLATNGDRRTFGVGFIRAACAGGGPAWTTDRDQTALASFAKTDGGAPLQCDEWVHTPTVVIQHDDIGNTYHNLADFWRVWLALALLQQPSCVPADDAAADPTWPLGPAGTEYVPDEATRGGAPAAPPCPAGTVSQPGIDPDEAQVMTMDGRIMCNTVMPDGSAVNEAAAGPREDCFGPYFAQYATWFGRGVVRAREFPRRPRVCFSALGWAASTPESHIWDKFDSLNPCTRSPLLARYAAYVAERWGLGRTRPRAFRSDACRAAHGAPAPVAGDTAAGDADAVEVPAAPPVESPDDDGTPTPPANAAAAAPAPGASEAAAAAAAATADACRPFVQVAYVARRRKPFSAQPVARRVVANEAAFLAALRGAGDAAGVDVHVVDADFAAMPYAEQVALVRASHVLVGMHGAGMTHGIHQADADECGGRTAVVELFPHTHGERGVRNMNVQVGRTYVSWTNADPARETDAGTVVDVAAVAALLRDVIAGITGGRGACANPGVPA